MLERLDTARCGKMVDGCCITTYIMGVNVTGSPFAQLSAPLGRDLIPALARGVAYADGLQDIDSHDFDSHFHAAAARFEARNALRLVSGTSDWWLRDRVPNSGILIGLPGDHTVRVLRSEGSTTPASGRSRKRSNEYGLEQLALDLGLGDRPLALIADWYIDEARLPVVSLGLPMAPWRYGQSARLVWRIPMPGVGDALDGASFRPRLEDVEIRIHGSEAVGKEEVGT